MSPARSTAHGEIVVCAYCDKTLQANTLFEANRGNGGTTRLVMLPQEPHWYTAMESNEQLVYDLAHWFNRYFKNTAPLK